MKKSQTDLKKRKAKLYQPDLNGLQALIGVAPAMRKPLWHRRGGFGLNEVIGIAAGIIIAVVVVIRGLRQFAASVLGQLTQWWNNMASGIFSN